MHKFVSWLWNVTLCPLGVQFLNTNLIVLVMYMKFDQTWGRSFRGNTYSLISISQFENIKTVYQETSEKTIGFRKRNSNEWLTSKTRENIEERSKLKEKVLCTRSPRLKEQVQRDYNEKEIKRSGRKGKRNYLEGRAKKQKKQL